MLKRGERIKAVLEAAHQAGYVDLTYGQVRTGILKAPATLELPVPGMKTLVRRYEKIASEFDALKIMRDLTMEAMRQYAEIDEELSGMDWDVLTIEERIRHTDLTNERKHWFAQSFKLAETCAAAMLKLENPNNVMGYPTVAPATQEDVARERQRLLDEIQAALPAAPDDDLIRTFGTNNIRPPSPPVTDAEVIDLDALPPTVSNDDDHPSPPPDDATDGTWYESE